MYLAELNILNFRNIESADLCFSPNINCLVGNNGMGKTNVLDAIYYLSFCKSSLDNIDSHNIRHEAEMAMLQGIYKEATSLNNAESGTSCNSDVEPLTVSCALRRGQKKQFRRGRKDYKRLIDHIGLLPLVLVSPRDAELVIEGSDERRRFMDSVIAQQNRTYLEHLTEYNALLKQRNALLKQMQEECDNGHEQDDSLLEVLELQMTPHAEYIFAERTAFIEAFIPLFQDMYEYIAQQKETVALAYTSQLQSRDLADAYKRTRQRDLMLGWTSQGVHKDDLEMMLGGYPLRRVGSQGQQKTYLIALKLAQAMWLTTHTLCNADAGQEEEQPKPILLLDDIFDKLDSDRVSRIVDLVGSDRFGQIFITDTDRQHLLDLLRPLAGDSKVFLVEDGEVRDNVI